MPKRILVAEDDIDIQTIVGDLLRFSGYEILLAKNGQEALDLMKDHSVDLLILDLSMPKVDGWTVLKRLRGDPKWAKLPILGLSAHALMGDKEKAIAAGCTTYITKPFQVPQIIEEASKLLRS